MCHILPAPNFFLFLSFHFRTTESMENPLLSSRAEAFPAGLRVLVVDDDPTWLKILEKMLRKCSYEVTTCCLATDALDMLRERKDRFDIVISDVNMPDMDGFKLLEQVGLEMDLPVIMMSIDGEISRVMKGVQHGACDYLLKPVRMKELRNIWQHVYRKKMHEVKEIEAHGFSEDIDVLRNGLEDLQDRNLTDGTEMSSAKKRKDVEFKDSGDHEFNDPSKLKKARVVWSVDLHKKFVNAVNQIGFDKVGPKKILDLMNVPGLTRENVASHLQKYRLYLSRLQKQGEGSPSGSAPGDLASTDNKGNFASIPKESVLIRNVGTTENLTPGIMTDAHIGDTKKAGPVQLTETDKAPVGEIPSTGKVKSVPSLGVYLSFERQTSNVDEKACESVTKKEDQPLYDGAPTLQFMQYPEQENLDAYSCLTSSTHQASFDLPSSSVNSVISSAFNSEKDWRDQHEMRVVLADPKNGHFAAATPPAACMIDSVSLQVKHGIIHSQDIEAVCKLDESPSKKDCFIDQTYNQCELSLNGETQPHSLLDNLSLCAIEKFSCLENLDLGGAGIFQYIDSTTAAQVQQSNWLEDLEVGGEYFYDPVDIPFLDGCLFAR